MPPVANPSASRHRGYAFGVAVRVVPIARIEPIEQSAMGRRPAWWSHRGFGLSGFRIEVGEDLLNHFRIIDASEDPHYPAAGRAGPDVDAKYPFQLCAYRGENSEPEETAESS